MGRPRALSGKEGWLRKERRCTQQREWVHNRRKAAVASISAASSASGSLAKEEHIARMESLNREPNQRCKGRWWANATDDDRATEAKHKREAQRRLHSTPAKQFLGTTARFWREFVENPFDRPTLVPWRRIHDRRPAENNPVKFRVENSWGDDSGDKGYIIMTQEWFREFVFEVIVDKKFASPEVLAVNEKEPKVLPAWDPMGALARC
ncbi:hypothetical protein ISCGN_007281 [Ixodes scapularis]